MTKTPQEAAREYACDGITPNSLDCASCFNIYGKCERNAYMEGFKEAIRWISVEDELPEYYKDVFVKYKRDGIVRYEVCWLAIGDDDNYLWTSSGGYLINRNDVVAWRPIEPVKE